MYGGYLPATFLTCALLSVGLALIFWWSGWQIARHIFAHQLVVAVWFMALAGLAGMRIDQSLDVRAVCWSLLILVNYFNVEDRPMSGRMLWLASGAGLLALVKFTFFIEFGVVFLVIGLDVWLRRRSFPWLVLAYVASLLCFWLLAGQSLLNFWAYLHYSLVIAGGYTQAMMMSGPDERFTTLGMLVSMGFLLAVVGVGAWKQRRFYALLPLAGWGGILFLVFKHGSVRHHSIHIITTTMQLLAAVLVCLALAWPVLKKSPRWISGCLGLAFALIFLFGTITYNRCFYRNGFPDETLWSDYGWTFDYNNLTAITRLVRNPAYLQKKQAQNLEEIHQQFPLPAIPGTVDVYPWRQAVLFANDLDYHPRPIIQSYSAYTPALAALNAAHLQGNDAPDNVLFDVDPQNHNYPAFEDGLSWPDLLTRYDWAGNVSGFALFKRARQPRTFHLEPLTNVVAVMGEAVTIATNQGLIWARLEIAPTLRGRFAAIVYKPQPLILLVSLNDGRRFGFNLVPGMAEGGFLLSPYIPDRGAFATLAAGRATPDLGGLQVNSVAISAACPGEQVGDYQSPIRWQFFRLEFPSPAGGVAPSVKTENAGDVAPVEVNAAAGGK